MENRNHLLLTYIRIYKIIARDFFTNDLFFVYFRCFLIENREKIAIHKHLRIQISMQTIVACQVWFLFSSSLMPRRSLEWWPIWWGESINAVSWWEAKNTVTDAERVRVQENETKAKQIAWQKAQQRKNNTVLAKFLTILFSRLPDHLISLIYTAFFTKRNAINWSMELPSINHMILLAALCTPLFIEEAKTLGMYQTFAAISPPTIQSWQSYLLYSKAMITRCALESLIPSIVPLLWELWIFEWLTPTDTVTSKNDIINLLITPSLQTE